MKNIIIISLLVVNCSLNMNAGGKDPKVLKRLALFLSTANNKTKSTIRKNPLRKVRYTPIGKKSTDELENLEKNWNTFHETSAIIKKYELKNKNNKSR